MSPITRAQFLAGAAGTLIVTADTDLAKVAATGELLAIDEHGLRSRRFAPAEPKGCLFEYVYLARPDTKIADRNVHATRVEIGRRLALEQPVADLGLDAPVILGEFSGRSDRLADVLHSARRAGYAGALVWSVLSDDDQSGYSPEVAAWAARHADDES